MVRGDVVGGTERCWSRWEVVGGGGRWREVIEGDRWWEVVGDEM